MTRRLPVSFQCPRCVAPAREGLSQTAHCTRIRMLFNEWNGHSLGQASQHGLADGPSSLVELLLLVNHRAADGVNDALHVQCEYVCVRDAESSLGCSE